MIRGEKPGATTYRQEGKGIIYQVTLLCDWSDVVPFVGSEFYPYMNPNLPQLGDAIPNNTYYHVVDVSAADGMAGECEYTITYSTERRLAESFCDESINIGVEPAEDLVGWIWENAGTPITDPQPRQTPLVAITLRLREALPPLNKVAAALYKVNSKIFRGISIGKLRFEGVSAENSYATDGTILSVSSVYEFAARSREWKYDWREPMQVRGSDGKLRFWHNQPPIYDDKGNNLVDQTYRDDTRPGEPVWYEGIRGTAGWDMPKKDGQYYYTECDFATDLELPRKVGDGA